MKTLKATAVRELSKDPTRNLKATAAMELSKDPMRTLRATAVREKIRKSDTDTNIETYEIPIPIPMR